MATAIEFNQISKLYRLGVVSTGTLSHDLRRWWTVNVRRKEDPYLKIGEVNDRSAKGQSDYVWALKDIDFKVEQGDVVGIIGKNGAGKSTLLKILSKVTAPTTGTIRARGRIGSLLEVGTGFHPEMTGRENIYLNGAILGMTKQEVSRKLDEIVDFSGCERYIDTPVKRYSSGMLVRLGFAVAAHLDPEILVVDEVLAVGDAEFQKKAIGKMQSVSHSEGRTVLFVSHNMGAVRRLCTKGILLEKGSTKAMGTMSEVIDRYLSDNIETTLTRSISGDEIMHDRNRSLLVMFEEITFCASSPIFASDEVIVMKIKVKAKKNVDDCRINYSIIASDGVMLGSHSSQQLFNIKSGEEKTLQYTIIPPKLAPGYYSLSFSVGTGNFSTGETNFDVLSNCLQFSIDAFSHANNVYHAKWDKGWGYMHLDAIVSELQ